MDEKPLVGIEIEWDEKTPEPVVIDLINIAEMRNIAYDERHKSTASVELKFEPTHDIEMNKSIIRLFAYYFPCFPKYCRVHVNVSGEHIKPPGDMSGFWSDIISRYMPQERINHPDIKALHYWKLGVNDLIRLEIRPCAVWKDVEPFITCLDEIYNAFKKVDELKSKELGVGQ